MFFPEIDRRGIKTVFMLGDTFDRRKYINFHTLARCKRYYFDKLAKRNIDTHIIVGNHDAHFKNTIEINSIDLVLGEYSNITPYSRPRSVSIDGTEILVIPWICEDNDEATAKAINTSRAPIVFGHLELKGFEMYRGAVMDHGADSAIFDKFELVLSGHFHHPSRRGNIQYLGAPYEMTWSDYDDPRGFHIFDTRSYELEFIRNPLRMFHRVWYDDSDSKHPKEALSGTNDLSALEGKTVKVIVKKKSNPTTFDRAMATIDSAKPASVQIVDDHLNKHDVLEEDIVVDAATTNTLDLLKEYVSKRIDPAEQDRVSRLLKDLYSSALESQWNE